MASLNAMARKYVELKQQEKELKEKMSDLRYKFLKEGSCETRDFNVKIVEQDKITINNVRGLIEKLGRTKLRGFINEYVQTNLVVTKKSA